VKRMLTVGLLVLSSVTWGVAFGKGSAHAHVAGGHSSPAALRADVANLAKARAVGTTPAKLRADVANLVKARAAKTKAK